VQSSITQQSAAASGGRQGMADGTATAIAKTP